MTLVLFVFDLHKDSCHKLLGSSWSLIERPLLRWAPAGGLIQAAGEFTPPWGEGGLLYYKP